MPNTPTTNPLRPSLVSNEVLERTPSEATDPMVSVIREIVQPIAQAQTTAAIEATNQTKILADITYKSYRWFFIIAICVLVLAGVALFMDKEQITSQLIVATFAFLGGIGIGRTTKR